MTLKFLIIFLFFACLYLQIRRSATAYPSSNYLPPIEITNGVNNVQKVILHEPTSGYSAEISLYGGQVLSWKNEKNEELLFVSKQATYEPPKAIRGGIPICYPQFSNLGPLNSHGFARNRIWSVDSNPPPPPVNPPIKSYVDLQLKPSGEDLKIWPHSFEFRFRVTLGLKGELKLTSSVRNTNSKPLSFTFAYHTYYSVSNVSDVRVEGLANLDYLDNLKNRERFADRELAVTFKGEVDRIYLRTPPTQIAIIDHQRKRTFVIHKQGLPDAVVWNPWEKKAKNMSDFGDDEYKYMVCVEVAAIENPITLKPNEEWSGGQELSVVASSYDSGKLDL